MLRHLLRLLLDNAGLRGVKFHTTRTSNQDKDDLPQYAGQPTPTAVCDCVNSTPPAAVCDCVSTTPPAGGATSERGQSHLVGYPMLRCKLLTTKATKTMTNCPTNKANRILHPCVTVCVPLLQGLGSEPPGGVPNAGVQVVDHQGHQDNDKLSHERSQQDSASVRESAQKPMLQQRPNAPSVKSPVAGGVLEAYFWHQSHQ